MNNLVRRGFHAALGVSAAYFGATAIAESSGEIMESKGRFLSFLPENAREGLSDDIEEPTERTIAAIRGIGGIAAAGFSPNTQPPDSEGVAYRNFAIGALLLTGVAVPSMVIGFRGHR